MGYDPQQVGFQGGTHCVFLWKHVCKRVRLPASARLCAMINSKGHNVLLLHPSYGLTP